ncbi:SRPBCC family protein [Paracoccus sp. Ld10]|uniref:SRPBCC family protein n=1 Tax=Paracoccus sp. Ld10 TaxID=649158 RepID=UPI00386BA7F2
MRTTTVLAGALGAVLALTGMAGAHGPSRLKTEKTVTLDATPDEVWEVIGRFDDMGWHPMIASTAMTPEGAAADLPDESTRVLTLDADGAPTITEQLMAIDDDKMMYKYMITAVDTAVLPVTNYSSTLQVTDKDGKAKVLWKGGFYRGFPNNEPPADLNDDAAMAAVDGVYQAGMDALAERFGRVD